MNRAIAKRPYFERREDKRYFLSRVAREVRAGHLEVHAYCLMTTHFHMLVRSPTGELSAAMRRIQNAYSRYFNRRRGRDGPLIRARFYSKRVDTEWYRCTVVRYIDANAVRAGIVGAPEEHEFGSARAFILGPTPRWLHTSWIDEQLYGAPSGGARRSSYPVAFSVRSPADVQEVVELVEARLASSRALDPLDDLIGSTPEEVQGWMRRKAELADGMEIGLPACGPSALSRAIKSELIAYGDWVVDSERGAIRSSELAHVGLLRDLCAEPFSRISSLVGMSAWKANRRFELHRELLIAEPRYSERVARVTKAALV